jgi:histidinol-phosphatase (PHP family)
MTPHDYHVHTNFSCDSDASMMSMCKAAIEASIEEIGITEHFDLHPKDPCKGYFQADRWWQEITRCRDEFQGMLTIRAGIELSEPHRHLEAVELLMQSYEWDFTLGALHWVGDKLIFEDRYYERTKQDAYQTYFHEMQEMVDGGLFDILAHMDIVKRYGFENYGPYDALDDERRIRSILRSAASRNMALELNTITLRRSINEPSPSRRILEWFREEGGKWLTLGSDAHAPHEVGFHFAQALMVIREVGFEYLASFNRRQPSPVPIAED